MVTALKPLIALSPLAKESSAIAEVGYDIASQTLAVKFKNSAFVHHYGEFSPHKYEQFLAADSPGKYHAEHIRGHHPHSLPSEEE